MIHILFFCLQSGRSSGKPSKTTGDLPSSPRVRQTLFQAFQKLEAAYAPNSKNAKDLTAAITYYISKDMLPFRTVERPGFLKLMKVAVPHYRVPSRTFFSKSEIPKLYNQVRADVENRLAHGTWFGATTDIWTSENGAGQPYISFTIQYLDPDWKLEAHYLETQFFPDNHSAQNIRDILENMLDEWNIRKENLVSVTTDNATNMVKAFTEFPDLWFGCFGHNLNLAISKALRMQRVDTAVKACRHLVQGFSRSWRRRRDLNDKLTAKKMTHKALIHDVVTRWGSTFKMLKRFLDLQQTVCETLAGDRGAWHLMPKDSHIRVIEQVSQLLEPLSDFTDALASEKRVTLSAIIPVMGHITGDILADKDGDSNLMSEMKKSIRDDLQARYTDNAIRAMRMACLIDPRFKKNFLEEPIAATTMNNCVKEAVRISEQLPGEYHENTSSDSPSPTSITQKPGDKSLAGLLKKIAAARQQRGGETSSSIEDKINKEIQQYLSLPPISAEEDPLVWWRGHASLLPHPATLAKKLLCIPATSVSSERMFSASGHIVSPLRSLLKPDKINMLTFLHFNLE